MEYIMYDRKTVEFYNNSVAKYIAWSKNNTSFKLEKKFLSLLVKPYSIFDIGCGAGHSAVWFSRKASKVIALDPSTKMTEKLTGLPKLETITQSILKIKYHNIFDGAWASFSLQHLKRQDQKKAFGIIYHALKHPGLFYLGIHKGEHSYRDSLGRLYVPRNEKELESELIEVGFKIQDITVRKSLSFEGTPIEVFHIFCIKI